MKNILVIQHTDGEGPGLLEPFLGSKGWLLDIRNMERGTLLPENVYSYQAMLILGGPMGAYQEDMYPYLYQVQNLIKMACHDAIPTVGICLGAQLIARALGSPVGPHKCKEIGWFSLQVNDEGQASRLFKGIKTPLWVFQWHQDSFAVPEGARLLASTRDCNNQAFSYKNRLWALQFHPEVHPEMIKDWVAVGAEDFNGLPDDAPEKVLESTDSLWKAALDTNLLLLNNLEEILAGC